MYTTIKLSGKTKEKLDNMKMYDSETYEEVIEDLIEDHLSLNPQFKKSLDAARKEIKQGKHKVAPNIKFLLDKGDIKS